MSYVFPIRGGLRLALYVAVFLLVPNSQVRAQFKLVHGPERVHTSQDINLYLGFTGNDRFDGIYLAIPSAWSLDDVRHLSEEGRSTKLVVQEIESLTNRFLLLFDGRMDSEDVLVLRVNTGLNEGRSSIRVTPYRTVFDRTGVRRTLLEGLSLLQPVLVSKRVPYPGNQVLSVSDSDDTPVSIRTAGLPDLSSNASYTIEFWLKTASLGAMIVSTWDGLESSSYPIELLVDGTGRLEFFQGTPGEHRSMRPDHRIADGSWHHVAVSHDAEKRRSKMFIDGIAADSLYNTFTLAVQAVRGLVLSGRPISEDGETDAVKGFTGLLDEFRIWPYARESKEIQSTMRQPISSQANGITVLSFDNPEEEARLIGNFDTLQKTESDLSFYEPIRDFQIHLDVSSVLLEWKAPDRNSISFVVERSLDGARYEVIGQVDRETGATSGTDTGNELFSFRDIGSVAGVSFYRIRQLFENGTDRNSPSVKVGMGVEEENATAVLSGNFPNPFNPVTTISYTLRETQHVRVSVWDLSGQMIALLVDETLDAGDYHVTFQAADLPSGNYFVRMRTAAGVRTHQMVLTK